MRKLNQANIHLIRSVCLLSINLFSVLSILAATPSLQQTSIPIDTSLAEKYIKKATTVSADSLSYFYKEALNIYQTAKNQTPDTAIWKRYFEVSNLWCKTLKDRQFALQKFPEFRKEAVQKFGSSSQAVANNYYNYAKTLANAKQYDETKVIYQKALNIYTAIRDSAGIVQVYFYNGKLHDFISEYEEAALLYQNAINSSVAFHGKAHKITTDCYYKKARFYYNQGQYQEGLKVLDTLIAIETQMYGLNSPRLTSTYILTGNIHFKETAYDTAIQYYEKAKAIYAQDSVKYSRGLASCLGNIGAVTIEKGDFEKANQLYLQAAAIKKAKYGENSITLAYTYYNIGSGYAEQGDFQSALDYFFKSARIIKKVRKKENADVAYVYTGIGGVYDQIGAWDEAMDYFQKVLRIRQATNTINHPETALNYDRIGALYQKKGDLMAAQTAYEKALSIRQNTLKPTHQAIGNSYFNLAGIHRQNGAFQQTTDLLQKALSIKEKQLYKYHPSIADIYLEQAKVAKDQKDLPNALHFLQTAITHLVPDFESLELADNPKIAPNFAYKSNLLNLLYQKGIALKQAYYQDLAQVELLEQAYSTLKNGSQLADLMRQAYQSDLSKKTLLSKVSLIYNELIEVGIVLANQPNAKVSSEDLFALMEKSKSILLLATIQEEQAKAFAGIPPTTIDQTLQLKKQIAFFENQLANQQAKGTKSTDKNLMEIEEKIFQFRQQSQNLIAQIEKDYPQYYQLKYDNQLASIADIQAALPTINTAFLQYTLTDNQLLIMAISPTKVQRYQQKVDSIFFQQLSAVKTFLNQNPVEQTKETQVKERQLFIQNAYDLQQQLLAPILAKMDKVENLIIIPDGALNYLPFEALLTQLPQTSNTTFDELAYVLHQHTIHYEYAATLWWQNTLDKSSQSHFFAGFAPTYQGKELLASRANTYSLLSSTATFMPLKHNQSEVNSLANTLNGYTLTGMAATESAFKKEAKNYGVLHLAMHAYVNDKNPNYSHLVFAPSKNSIEDRYLYAYELYNMRLNADLAVLSACETGNGQIQKGEGVMSLSRAFKYAGVPNIVMSFWKADDFYTKYIMTQFYQFLKLGVGKNEALKQAKIAQLATAKDNKEAAHPFYWANFVLVGNAQPIQFKQPIPWIWMASGICCLVVLLWGWKNHRLLKNKYFGINS